LRYIERLDRIAKPGFDKLEQAGVMALIELLHRALVATGNASKQGAVVVVIVHRDRSIPHTPDLLVVLVAMKCRVKPNSRICETPRAHRVFDRLSSAENKKAGAMLRPFRCQLR
jgi:hypothetical protein